jgi:hypothetical protein
MCAAREIETGEGTHLMFTVEHRIVCNVMGSTAVAVNVAVSRFGTICQTEMCIGGWYMLAVCCTEHHDSISENNAERHKLTDGINPLPIIVLTPTATETVSGNRIGSCGPEKVILVTFSPRDTPDQFEKLRCIVLIDRIYSGA